MFWQIVHDVKRLDADIDDTQQEVEDVAGLVVLAGPVVGIVIDERLLVLRDGVTLHNPFDGRFAVDDILVGFLRDVLDGDVAVVDDDALIVLTLETHFVNDSEKVVGSVIYRCLDITASRWVTLSCNSSKELMRVQNYK